MKTAQPESNRLRLDPGNADRQPKSSGGGIQSSIESLRSALADRSELPSEEANARAKLRSSGLYRRLDDLDSLLERARKNQSRIETISYWRMAVAIFGGIGVVAIPILGLLELEEDANFRQFLLDSASLVGGLGEVILLLVGWFSFVLYLERNRRVQLAVEAQNGCRIFLHIIESHLGSKYFAPLWLIPARGELVLDRGVDSCGRFREAGAAIHYLAYAGAMAMVAAKIAALYAQWLPRPDVQRQADEIFLVALEIERNCLSKSILVRDGQLRPRVEEGVASDSA